MIAPAKRWMLLAMLSPLVAFAATPEQSAEDESGPAVLPRPIDDAALERYRRFDAEPPMADWRAANDEVGRLGGFMGHMRPAPEPEHHMGAHQK